jgi:hypothetical protein
MIYLIVLLEADDTVKARITDRYPEAYEYNETAYLVTDSSPITETVAIEAGIKGPNRVDGSSGFVIKLGDAPSYSGFTNRALWDWLAAAAEGSS